MDTLSKIFLIKQKEQNCPFCKSKLIENSCNLALYKSKEKTPQTYIEVAIPYCHLCKKHFIKHNDIQAITKITSLTPKTKSIKRNANKNSLPKEEANTAAYSKYPRIEQRREKCFTCGGKLSTRLLKHTIKNKAYLETIYINVQIYTPYCNNCNKHIVMALDYLHINNIKAACIDPRDYRTYGETTLIDLICKHFQIQKPSSIPKPKNNKATHSKLTFLSNQRLDNAGNTLGYLGKLDELKKIHISFGDIHCYRNDHDIAERKAIVYCAGSNGNVQEAEIYAHYCINCDKYFLQYNAFKRYQPDNLLVQYEFMDGKMYYGKSGSYYLYDGLNDESLLRILGYHTGLSDGPRHTRLATILLCKQMSKPDIIRHIDWLIRFGRNNPRHQNSIPIWEDDLRFIMELGLGKHDVVYGQIVMRVGRLGLR